MYADKLQRAMQVFPLSAHQAQFFNTALQLIFSSFSAKLTLPRLAKKMKVAFFIYSSLIVFCLGGEMEQRISIPEAGPDGGKPPLFSVLIDEQYVGDVVGDAVLSNGRFFGFRWIARPVDGKRIWIREGEPYTLYVGHLGTVRLVPKTSGAH